MKKLLPLLFFTAVFCTANAQEVTQLNVLYEMQHKRELDKDEPVVKKQMLSVAKNESRYVEQSIFNSNNKAALEERRKMIEKMQSLPTSGMRTVSGSPMMSATKKGAVTKEEVITNLANKTLAVTGVLGLKTYSYTAKIPAIKWKLQNDKKTILGYECQKATGDFGGRTYEVWFTTALPYSFGPWKLGGLPGLILAANDSKNEVVFTALEITKNTDPDELVTSYLSGADVIKVKEKEYKATEKMLVTDPESLTAAQFPNTKVMISNTDNSAEKTIKKVKKYNPVEL